MDEMIEDRAPGRSRGGVRPLAALESHVKLIRALRTPGVPTQMKFLDDAGYTHRARQAAGGRSATDAMGHVLADELDRAATVVVTDRMLSLVLERMADVRFGQALGPEDPPFRAGYVVLPRPVLVPNDDRDHDPDTLTDVRPDHYSRFDCGMWVPSSVARTSSAEDRELYRAMGWPENVAGISYIQGVSRHLGLQIARDWERDGNLPEAPEVGSAFAMWNIDHLPIYVAGWAFDTPWDPAEREPSFVLTAAGEFERRFWLAMFRTLREEVVAPVKLPRRFARQAARYRHQLPEVVVADLRRIKHRDREELLEDGAVIMWSHRWRVREHTRTYHRGTPQERTITIHSYVKGPEHLPLVEKDSVYRLSR